MQPYTFRIEEKTRKILDNLKDWEVPYNFAGILRATLEKELRLTLRIHQDKIVTGFIKKVYADLLVSSLDENQARNKVYTNCSLFCASIWQNYGIRISPSELTRQCQFYFFNIDYEREQKRKDEEKKKREEQDKKEDSEIENIFEAEVAEDVKE